jgi:hypothetical protein
VSTTPKFGDFGSFGQASSQSSTGVPTFEHLMASPSPSTVTLGAAIELIKADVGLP